MMRDNLQMVSHIAVKLALARVAAKLCKVSECQLVLRKALRLLVGNHLQAVLNCAQKKIRTAQVGNRLAGNPALFAEFIEHIERPPAPQTRPLAAKDQLLGLDKKFYLPNAAAPEFKVVTRHGNFFVAANRVNLALHRRNVRDRGVIKIFPPDKGREFGKKTRAERNVASDGPCFDQSRPLPVLAKVLIVGVGSGQRDCDRRRARIGTKPQIDAQNIAVGRPFLKQSDKSLGDTDKERCGCNRAGNGRAIRIEKDNNIDVARIIELAGAKLS